MRKILIIKETSAFRRSLLNILAKAAVYTAFLLVARGCSIAAASKRSTATGAVPLLRLARFSSCVHFPIL